MKCDGCGAEVNARFCPYCGKEVTVEKGVTIINNYYQSPQDQRQMVQPQMQPQIVYREVPVNNISSCNKWVDFFLCLFLGYFGIHKFYEGKIGMGILYIFTVGLFGLGTFIDLIIILCNGAKDKYGRMIR